MVNYFPSIAINWIWLFNEVIKVGYCGKNVCYVSPDCTYCKIIVAKYFLSSELPWPHFPGVRLLIARGNTPERQAMLTSHAKMVGS